jgi:hypothetical protein
VADQGFKQAMQARWVALDKAGGEPRVVPKVEAGSVGDAIQAQLAAVAGGQELPKADLDNLAKKRKLIKLE